MYFNEHPLLNDPSLTALILHTAAEGPTDDAALQSRLQAILATAGEQPGDADDDLRDHMRSLCRDLAIAGLLEVSDERYTLTDRGRQALADHPRGLDRADLEQWPEYAAHVQKEAAAGEPREDNHPAAYRQGAAARFAGQPATDNPFPPDTADHGFWEDGWAEAEPRGTTL